jgi:lipopolysaccharide export system protein LptA
VAPTYRTLDEVDGRVALTQATASGTADAVFQITSNGTYFLTGDVVVGQDQSAIRVAAQDVTIDLNGFALVGEGLFATTSGDEIRRAPGALSAGQKVRVLLEVSDSSRRSSSASLTPKVSRLRRAASPTRRTRCT